MVRVRLQNNTNGNVDGVGNMHTNGGIRPPAPVGLGQIEVLEEKLKAIDFPPLA